MLDKIYSWLISRKDIVNNPDYAPEMAIVKTKLLNEGSKRLVVIFPMWGGRGFLFNQLLKQYSDDCWAVLAFQFHDQLLEAEDEIVVKSFLYIQDKVPGILEKLDAENKYTEIRFVGVSLGNVAMNMVADKFDKFTGAIIVVGGDDLAKDIWHGYRTADIRKGFRKQHVGIRILEEHWNKIAPKNNVKGYAGKDVTFLIAKNDMMVLSKYQYCLADAAKKAGAKVTIVKTRFGHTLTVARFCIFGKPVK